MDVCHSVVNFTTEGENSNSHIRTHDPHTTRPHITHTHTHTLSAYTKYTLASFPGSPPARRRRTVKEEEPYPFARDVCMPTSQLK